MYNIDYVLKYKEFLCGICGSLFNDSGKELNEARFNCKKAYTEKNDMSF